MKKKILFLLIIFMPFMVCAEELILDWQKEIEITDNEYYNEIIKTYDGNFLVILHSSSNENRYDAKIIKFDEEGNLIWEKTWGGNNYDHFYDIMLTDDGGFIAVGSSGSTNIDGLTNNGRDDALIVKYDKDGNVLWQRNYGGSSNDKFKQVILTGEDYIVLCESYSKDIEGMENRNSEETILVKYDKNGHILWEKNYANSVYSYRFSSIIKLNENQYSLVGRVYNKDASGKITYNNISAVIIKCDNNDTILWERIQEGVMNFDEVIELDEGSLIAMGQSNSTNIDGITNNGQEDIFIIKYDKDGNVIWKNGYGTERIETLKYEYDDDVLVLPTTNNDFVIVVYSTEIFPYGNGVYYDGAKTNVTVIKYDKDGNIIWKNNWGGNDYDRVNKIILSQNLGYIVAGETASTDIPGIINLSRRDALLTKYSDDGNIAWQKNYGGTKVADFENLLPMQNNDILILGTLSNKFMLLKYSTEYNIEKSIKENGTSTIEQQGIYGIVKPIPNEGYEVDKIIVKDKSGNVLDVEVTKQEDGTYSFELYTDVSVEVLFKEKLVNPKTGVSSLIGVIFTLFLISISSFFIIRNCNNSYEL